MRVSFVGLGRLGLPAAVATALNDNFKVYGYDVNPLLRRKRAYYDKEVGRTNNETFQNCFDAAPIVFADSLEEAVKPADLILIAVQTPHDEKFSGSTKLDTEVRKDFDYTYLVNACQALKPLVSKNQTVAVISTTLPGVIRKNVLPILGDLCEVCYSPSFIAMGTVIRDFLHPFLTLVGTKDGSKSGILDEFYTTLCGCVRWEDKVIYTMTYESAELVKVGYNAFTSMKVVYANSLMEIAHSTPHCNVDDVTNAMGDVIGRKYFTSGMGMGGRCFPRDLIAMSYLANKLSLSFNPFEVNAKAREQQAEWLCCLLLNEGKDLPKVILGKTFKSESDLVDGSCALLIADILRNYGHEFCQYDPHVDFMNEEEMWLHNVLRGDKPVAVLIATKHERFARWSFPRGSVVVDPFRYIPDQEGVRIIRVGIGKSNENKGIDC